jgi:hypothetical protein
MEGGKRGERKGEKEERIMGRETQGRRMEEIHGNHSSQPIVTLSPLYTHS